jgi:hypothetical protein
MSELLFPGLWLCAEIFNVRSIVGSTAALLSFKHPYNSMCGYQLHRLRVQGLEFEGPKASQAIPHRQLLGLLWDVEAEIRIGDYAALAPARLPLLLTDRWLSPLKVPPGYSLTLAVRFPTHCSVDRLLFGFECTQGLEP